MKEWPAVQAKALVDERVAGKGRHLLSRHMGCVGAGAVSWWDGAVHPVPFPGHRMEYCSGAETK